MSQIRKKISGLPVIKDRAARIDIGSRFHVVAVPPELCNETVRTFQAFTANLESMADWLVSFGIRSVAMESTGVYWIPAFEILEKRGIEVILANARESKSVPGRKSDVNDAQWLQRLHACGLLRSSFRPTGDTAALRAFLRLRERHTDYASAHIQHMQKTLTLMNLQLHHVVSDVTGATGMRIIRAIVGGERDPSILANMRDRNCKSSTDTIQAILVGNYQLEHVLALQQAVALYDFYLARIADWDTQIELTLAKLTANQETQPSSPIKRRCRKQASNPLNFDVHSLLFKLAGPRRFDAN